jgi:hypothetical protein
MSYVVLDIEGVIKHQKLWIYLLLGQGRVCIKCLAKENRNSARKVGKVVRECWSL